ncbi:MAG TPA: heme exporter protein CcmD [Burkholderiales bacterium]|nr:heme exporter protein CcmD [Burkholderiales bacterium]
MSWASWSDFFAMGGYGFYVWGAYGVTFILLLLEIIFLLAGEKKIGSKP